MSVVLFITVIGILLSQGWLAGSSAVPGVELEAQWSFHRRLVDYKAYGAITLQRVEIPQHTVALNLSLKAHSSSGDCKTRQVKIFASPQGLPVVSRNGETFPSDSYVSDRPVHNLTLSTVNTTTLWSLQDLPAGQLFLMSVLPRTDTRIRQQGLGEDCEYFISLKSSLHYIPSYKLQEVLVDERNEVTVEPNKLQLVSFHLPVDVLSLIVEIGGCADPCPINVTRREALNHSMWNSPTQDCSWKNGTCLLQMEYPAVDRDFYVGLTSSVNTSHRLSLTAHTTYCKASMARHPPHHKHLTNGSCIMQNHLGRETPAMAADGMYDHFVYWDKELGPHSTIDLNALDQVAAVMGFRLRTTDIGSSLTVTLRLPKQKLPTQVQVNLCVSSQHLASAMACENGALLQLTSLDSSDRTQVLIPYPHSGQWYVALQSRCYHGNTSSLGSVVPCPKYPGVNITIQLSPCVDGGCGRYGACKFYFDSNLLYSSCSCYAGWRGYGCNDGSEADSNSSIEVGVYLLTLSNLFFIPGICLALYRRHFVESAVYAFNMFFSTFYHACDTSMIFRFCLMPYTVLSFADFFASLLSFWVTLLAMARIPPGVRAFCHMMGVLFIAVAVMHNKHGLLEQLLPIAVGIAFVLGTWGREIYQRKRLFPSRRRLIFFITPGILLAVLGLIFNLALETEDNYKYMHSVWHLMVSCSIVFLLPPRRGGESNKPSGYLSIQSGDILQDGLLADDQIQANIRRADEPQGNSDPPSPCDTPRDRGGSFRLTNRERRGRNLIL